LQWRYKKTAMLILSLQELNTLVDQEKVRKSCIWYHDRDWGGTLKNHCCMTRKEMSQANRTSPTQVEGLQSSRCRILVCPFWPDGHFLDGIIG
jgi:hypothetical protein